MFHLLWPQRDRILRRIYRPSPRFSSAMQLFAAGLVTSSPSAQFDLARDSVTRLLRHDGTVARPLGGRWLSERLKQDADHQLSHQEPPRMLW